MRRDRPCIRLIVLNHEHWSELLPAIPVLGRASVGDDEQIVAERDSQVPARAILRQTLPMNCSAT